MWNKIILHIFAALFSGFTFWKIGDGTFSLQLRLFAIFNFIFVAPGCINQMQPFFLHNRDIFETREKKVCGNRFFILMGDLLMRFKSIVQNIPLACLHWCPNHHRNTLPHYLCNSLFCLFLLYRRIPNRGQYFRTLLSTNDLYVFPPDSPFEACLLMCA